MERRCQHSAKRQSYTSYSGAWRKGCRVYTALAVVFHGVALTAGRPVCRGARGRSVGHRKTVAVVWWRHRQIEDRMNNSRHHCIIHESQDVEIRRTRLSILLATGIHTDRTVRLVSARYVAGRAEARQVGEWKRSTACYTPGKQNGLNQIVECTGWVVPLPVIRSIRGWRRAAGGERDKQIGKRRVPT